MNFGRVAMAGLLAVLAAGCTGAHDGAAPNPTSQESAAANSGTSHAPAAGRTSATGGSAARTALPAVPAPRPVRPANSSVSVGGKPAEPPPAPKADIATHAPDGIATPKPDIAALAPGTSAAPTTDGAGRAVDSAGDEARYTAGADAPMRRDGDASGKDRDVLAMLRDRSASDGGNPRGGPDAPGRLFSRSTIDDCTVIRRLGDAVALSRSRGAPESEAVRDGIDRLVGDFGLPRDQRTKFTSRVYGILLYRLEATHTVQAFASYAHAVCRVYRDTNQIIPVDPVSEREINDQLRTCDGTTAVREELEDCILKGLSEIVARAS